MLHLETMPGRASNGRKMWKNLTSTRARRSPRVSMYACIDATPTLLCVVPILWACPPPTPATQPPTHTYIHTLTPLPPSPPLLLAPKYTRLTWPPRPSFALVWAALAECCIFHRRRHFGDWSDDDDSAGDSDGECDCGPGQDGAAQPNQPRPSGAGPQAVV